MRRTLAEHWQYYFHFYGMALNIPLVRALVGFSVVVAVAVTLVLVALIAWWVIFPALAAWLLLVLMIAATYSGAEKETMTRTNNK